MMMMMMTIMWLYDSSNASYNADSEMMVMLLMGVMMMMLMLRKCIQRISLVGNRKITKTRHYFANLKLLYLFNIININLCLTIGLKR